MNKICTDIKQSKRLIELGIDLNTADMCYMYRHWEIDEDSIGDQTDAHIGFSLGFYDGADNGKTYHYIPAWSLSALLRMIKSEFYGETIYGDTITYKVDFRKYKFTDDVDLYQIAYGSIKFDVDGQYSFTDMINTGQKEDPIDAVFQMVCWLKENGKILCLKNL